MQLQNYASGQWVVGSGKQAELIDAITGDLVGTSSSGGLDFGIGGNSIRLSFRSMSPRSMNSPRSSFWILSFALCTITTHAQTVIFSDNFDSGALDTGWIWTGNMPIFASGWNSDSCITIESTDLTTPPVVGNVLNVLFHPLPIDLTQHYVAAGAYKLDAPLGMVNAVVGLGWFNPNNGFFNGWGFGGTSATWSPGNSPQILPDVDPFGGDGVFGVGMAVLGPGDTPLEAHGYFDEISVLTFPISTDVHPQRGTIGFSCFPNPVIDDLKISFPPGSMPSAIGIRDAQGRLHASQPVSGEQLLSLDLSGLPAGVYFLSVLANSGIEEQRFIKL